MIRSQNIDIFVACGLQILFRNVPLTLLEVAHLSSGVSMALLRVLTLQLRCLGRLMALTRAGGKRPASRHPRSCTPAGGGLTSLPVGTSPCVSFAPSHPQPSLSACDLLWWLRSHHSRS